MERTKTKRRGWRAVIGLVMLAGVVAVLWRAWPRERLLLNVAQPVVGIDTTLQDACWLNDHQLLIVTSEDRESRYSDWKGVVERLDITTGTRERQTPLTNLLLRTTKDPWPSVGHFEVSPDGVWLEWQAYWGHGASRPSERIAQLDGSHYRAWDFCHSDETIFVDSQHLVRLSSFAPFIVCDLQDPHKDRKCPKPEQAQAVLAQYALKRSFQISASGSQSDTSVDIETYRTIDILQREKDAISDRQQEIEPVQRHKVALPPGAMLRDAKVNPQQQAVVYQLEITHTNPLSSWLHRLMPRFSSEPPVTEGLWVSRADGQGLHEIGHIPIQPNTDEADEATEGVFADLKWLPDGKRISFIYRGTLYVVPAEPEK